MLQLEELNGSGIEECIIVKNNINNAQTQYEAEKETDALNPGPRPCRSNALYLYYTLINNLSNSFYNRIFWAATFMYECQIRPELNAI